MLILIYRVLFCLTQSISGGHSQRFQCQSRYSSRIPFSQQKFLSIRIALANSSMRTLISGAHGNQHSPELTTPTQWNARSQNSPQNASASCYMHTAAFTYHPTTTHHASKLPFLLKKIKKNKNKSMKAYFKASSKQNHLIHYRSEYRPLQNPLWDISVPTMPTINNS